MSMPPEPDLVIYGRILPKARWRTVLVCLEPAPRARSGIILCPLFRTMNAGTYSIYTDDEDKIPNLPALCAFFEEICTGACVYGVYTSVIGYIHIMSTSEPVLNGHVDDSENKYFSADSDSEEPGDETSCQLTESARGGSIETFLTGNVPRVCSNISILDLDHHI